MTLIPPLASKGAVLLLAAADESERELRLRELLLASGILNKTDEIRFSPPDEGQRGIWEERTFHVRSTYVRSRERYGQIVKPKKDKKNAPSQRSSMLITPETSDSYRFKYWIKRSPSSEDQNEAMLWNNKGNEFFNEGRYNEALECYDRAIAISPYSSVSWNNRGAALHDMGKQRDALRCYEMALKMNAENAVAWTGRGAALHSLKKYDEALVCYDKAIEINPMLSDAWYNRGILLKKLGAKERGEEDLKRAEEIEKNNP